ncbi:MAG: serine/threonine-protein kinase, partial [Planctomycetota bacterium]
MAESYRRVIARPDGVDDGDWSRLGEMLAAAVDRQQQQIAAQSPHVLRFTGGLQEREDNSAFFVEHEPASAMPIGALFDRSAPPLHESQLLRVTVALFDALRAAHAPQQQRPTAHGSVCPGVVLFAADGVAKVTDFGFAPAVYSALGEQRYINLAVGPAERGRPGTQITGRWEVLTADEFERDDRICAFIDPEKYGNHTLNAFEPGSDVISAGFVLHLLAEHQHPYLYSEPDAHRMVEMSEFMAMARYNGARRQDLRESENPGVRIWCDLIAGTLARLSDNRPSATQIVEGLAEHVKPEDAGDLLRRQLDEIEEALRQGKTWDEVRDAARSVAEDRAAPADVAQRAQALFARAEADTLIEQARATLKGSDWPSARQPIETLLGMTGLPAAASQQARELGQVLDRNLSARNVLDDVEARTDQADTTDAVAAADLMEELLARLGELHADLALAAPVRARLETAHQTASGLLDQVLPAATAAKEADRTAATDWLEQLESALDAKQWQPLEKLLGGRDPVGPRVRPSVGGAGPSGCRGQAMGAGRGIA